MQQSLSSDVACTNTCNSLWKYKVMLYEHDVLMKKT